MIPMTTPSLSVSSPVAKETEEASEAGCSGKKDVRFDLSPIVLFTVTIRYLNLCVTGFTESVQNKKDCEIGLLLKKTGLRLPRL